MTRHYRSADDQVQDPQPSPPPQEPPIPDDVPDRPPVIVIVPFYKKPLFWVAVIALIIAIIAVIMYSRQNKVVYEF